MIALEASLRCPESIHEYGVKKTNKKTKSSQKPCPCSSCDLADQEKWIFHGGYILTQRHAHLQIHGPHRGNSLIKITDAQISINTLKHTPSVLWQTWPDAVGLLWINLRITGFVDLQTRHVPRPTPHYLNCETTAVQYIKTKQIKEQSGCAVFEP